MVGDVSDCAGKAHSFDRRRLIPSHHSPGARRKSNSSESSGPHFNLLINLRRATDEIDAMRGQSRRNSAASDGPVDRGNSVDSFAVLSGHQ